MKKTCSILLVLSLVFMVAACGSSPQQPGPTATPDWLNDFPPDDALWGVGIAKLAADDKAMEAAENNGRVAIARQLNAKVQAMIVDYYEEAGNPNSPSSIRLYESVSRQITDSNVSGARPIKRWQAPDKTWWYLVELKKSDAVNSVASILGNQEADYAEFKAQKALQMLDAQLEKSEKPLQVNN